MAEEFILVSKQKIKDYETKIKELESKNSSSIDENNLLENISKQLSNEFTKLLETNNEVLENKFSTLINNNNIIIDKEDKTSNSDDMAKILNQTEHLKDQSSKLELLPLLEKKLNLIHSDMKVNQKDTVENLKLLVEHLQDMDSFSNLSKGIDDIRNFISNSLSTSNEFLEDQFSNHLEIIEKLQEIELFMTNLRILLSYVKPSYIERER